MESRTVCFLLAPLPAANLPVERETGRKREFSAFMFEMAEPASENRQH